MLRVWSNLRVFVKMQKDFSIIHYRKIKIQKMDT